MIFTITVDALITTEFHINADSFEDALGKYKFLRVSDMIKKGEIVDWREVEMTSLIKQDEFYKPDANVLNVDDTSELELDKKLNDMNKLLLEDSEDDLCLTTSGDLCPCPNCEGDRT